jgi:hypothetical protein
VGMRDGWSKERQENDGVRQSNAVVYGKVAGASERIVRLSSEDMWKPEFRSKTKTR